ncbi:MAG: hypothetical protein J0M08_14060 [Bacteroidetes bacterium]|nr:hypothetical protein [Bacteroidota bacterium]
MIPSNEFNLLIDCLKAGKIACLEFNDETLLVCNACIAEASIKLASAQSPQTVLISEDRFLIKHVKNVPEQAFELIDVSENPITIIYDYPFGLAPSLATNENTVAIQYNKNIDLAAIIRRLNNPLAVIIKQGTVNYNSDFLVRINSPINFANASILQLKNNGIVKILKH